jgi:2-dehydro-3-deoxyphosphogluconate aldolase / (4S)-4-hydroxy-2-oxoglutarate aldolase
VVGAGTVLTPEQLAAVDRQGACFAFSPGPTETLLDAARDAAVPLLPGAATATEIVRLLERGYRQNEFLSGPSRPAASPI